jgi:hypothetical protein
MVKIKAGVVSFHYYNYFHMYSKLNWLSSDLVDTYNIEVWFGALRWIFWHERYLHMYIQ